MRRRLFLKALMGAISSLPLLSFAAPSISRSEPTRKETLVQSSPVADFQFHAGGSLWDSLRKGDTLHLVPEPENPHDEQAVKVMWRDIQIGYVPRRDNTAVSQMLKRNEPLTAKIAELKSSRDPWERIAMDIFLLQG